MAGKVDLKPIQNLYLENIIGAQDLVGHQMVADLFKGTGLYLDEKSGELQTLVDGKVVSRSIQKEAAWIHMVKAADKNGDGLDVEETKKMLEENFSEEEYKKIDPEQFQKSIEDTIQKRWARLALNMQKFDGDLNFKPTLDALDTYSEGIYLDELRQARSVFPLNGLTKTAGNIVTFPVYNTVFRIAGKAEENWMLMDDLAKAGAQKRHDARKAAMNDLRDVIQEGLFPKEKDEKGNVKKDGKVLEPEKWAFDGNLEEALKRLKEKKPESYQILSTVIPAGKIHKILTIDDDKERAKALLAFAEAERPDFLGYMGGNATPSGFLDTILPWRETDYKSWSNYTGRHNNIFFARSVFAFLGNKSQTDDPNFDAEMRRTANAQRKEMLGDGGSFANISAVAVTNLGCGATWVLSAGRNLPYWKSCDSTPLRSWGDEAKMDAVGRSIDIGITAFTTYKGLQFWKEAWAFRRLKGWRGVWDVYRAEAGFAPRWSQMYRIPYFGPRFFKNGFKPIPAKALEEAKKSRLAKMAESGEEAPKGWWGKKWDVAKEKFFGSLTPLSEAQLKSLKAMGHHTGKFMNRLTDGVLIVGAAGFVDYRMEAYYNPFETNHELELSAYPDVTKPDPSLNTPAKK